VDQERFGVTCQDPRSCGGNPLRNCCPTISSGTICARHVDSDESSKTGVECRVPGNGRSVAWINNGFGGLQRTVCATQCEG
jgi:predicted NBD/HSP70 family sugar kinase